MHWNAAVNYGWNAGTSYFRIDGDTPSGTEMIVYSAMSNATHITSKYVGYNTFFTWATPVTITAVFPKLILTVLLS